MVRVLYNSIARLCSWQALPILAWLLFVMIAAEPLFCQSGYQYRPHHHATAVATSGMDAAAFDTNTPIQAFICLLSDPLLPQDSQQPATIPNPSHEHVAVQVLLVSMLTMTLLLGTPLLCQLLPRAWILVPLDRPPIHLQVVA